MRTLRNQLVTVFALAIFSVGGLGCDSGGSSGNDSLPAEKAKEEVQNVDDELSSDLANLTGGEARTVLRGLNRNVQVERDGTTFERPLGAVLLAALDQQGIAPATSTGEYSWDSQEQAWVEQGGADGDVVLNFPTSPDESGNNATFTLAEYVTTGVTLDGEQEKVPTSVDASVTVDDAGEILSVDLSNTSFYDSQIDDTQVPKSVLLKVLTAPQFHTFRLDSPSKDQFNVEFDLEKGGEGGEKVMGLIVEAALNDDFDNVSDAASVDELTGSIELGPNATIDYTINVDGAASLPEDPSLEAVNNQFSATLNVGGQKAGDITFAEVNRDGETEIVPVVVYPDGTQEALRRVFSETLNTVSGVSMGDFSRAATSAASSVKDAVRHIVQ